MTRENLFTWIDRVGQAIMRIVLNRRLIIWNGTKPDGVPVRLPFLSILA